MSKPMRRIPTGGTSGSRSLRCRPQGRNGGTRSNRSLRPVDATSRPIHGETSRSRRDGTIPSRRELRHGCYWSFLSSHLYAWFNSMWNDSRKSCSSRSRSKDIRTEDLRITDIRFSSIQGVTRLLLENLMSYASQRLSLFM